MTANELRQKYIDFFKSRGHVQIPSASLIPENDPSVLFTTAGMHPLVPYLLGAEHPAGKRLVNFQKCVRTVDIDGVGDATHLTFFEMLGNWSLGDYFKDEAIKWSFEFLTSKQWLGIPLSKLAVTVFAGDHSTSSGLAIPRDEESAGIWLTLGLPQERIAYLGKEDNWWPAGGKHLGPQGPNTEMFYWTGVDPAPTKFDPADQRWVEIWNDVFMLFNRTPEGKLEPLTRKNVDTGMGLERTAAVLQGKKSVYETELFAPLISAIGALSGRTYGTNQTDDRSTRIIADHLRAATFILGDRFGVAPSNVDQGYVLRRLIRRAIRHGRQIGIEGRLSVPIAEVVIEAFCEIYPELKERQEIIVTELEQEETKFRQTLDKGLKEFDKIFALRQTISGQDAFNLYQSFGFPWELTAELARDRSLAVDRAVFESEFQKHQERSRAGAAKKFAGGLADHSEQSTKYHTATHLLHQALRQVLGEHVFQKGSNITPERLRFDFSHPQKMTAEQIEQVETIVNQQISQDLPVHFEMLTVDEAKARGAIGLFEDKYAALGDKIKVYFVGDEKNGYVSQEICGGPHVEKTGKLGYFKIVKEEASSAGVRRIKAVLSAI